MELILSMAIIGSAAGAGYLAARPFDNRILHLQELITCFRILEAEMNYRRDPLPELFENIGARFPGPAGQFFLQAGRRLKLHPTCDLYHSWSLTVHEVYEGSSLTGQDMDILCEAGIKLGKTDLDSQKSLFIRFFARMEQQAALAESEKRTKGRVYRSLCTAAGVLLVIVLL